MNVVGYPFSPKIVERANCGPTVLATLLGINTDEAMQAMDEIYKKGWNGYTNVGHIRAVLEHHGISMIKTKEYEDLMTIGKKPIALFIQVEGPWMGKGWRAEYTHTHWALVHNRKVMDVNNIHLDIHDATVLASGGACPPWISRATWEEEVMPAVANSFEGATGWHVRAGYYVEEMK